MKEFQCEICGTLNRPFFHACIKCGFPYPYTKAAYEEHEEKKENDPIHKAINRLLNRRHCPNCLESEMKKPKKPFYHYEHNNHFSQLWDNTMVDLNLGYMCPRCQYEFPHNEKGLKKYYKKCDSCGTSNVYLNPYCRKCGHSFDLIRCLNCGHINAEIHNVCLMCGVKLDHTQKVKSENTEKPHKKRAQKKLNIVVPDEIKRLIKYFYLEYPIEQSKLKTQYHKLLSKYHPDKYYHLGNEISQKAEQKTKEIIRNYEILTKWLNKTGG